MEPVITRCDHRPHRVFPFFKVHLSHIHIRLLGQIEKTNRTLADVDAGIGTDDDVLVVVVVAGDHPAGQEEPAAFFALVVNDDQLDGDQAEHQAADWVVGRVPHQVVWVALVIE